MKNIDTWKVLKRSPRVLVIIIFLMNSVYANAQLDKLLKKGTDLVKQTKRLLNELNGMTKAYQDLKVRLNSNSTEFNKNVRVAKGANGAITNSFYSNQTESVTELKIKDGQFLNLVWEPTIFFDGQMFASAIISMAGYKQQLDGILEAISRPVGFSLYSTKTNIPIRYEIESVDKSLFDKISGTYMYEGGGKVTYLAPLIPWNYENLAKRQSSTPVSIYFRLFDDKGSKVEKLETAQIRSINDCIYYYKDIDMKFMFSAFVQEECKEIDVILREALNSKMIQRWVGYQATSKEVDEQVAAIWRVLHERGFVYSNITETIGDNGNVHSQTVRTMENSLKTSQANCVDGTVVFASILKKIGINPIMVLIPGHCFLGYYTDASNKTVKFLETTWVSHSFIYGKEGKKEIELLAPAKTKEDKIIAYRKLFDAAQEFGTLEFEKYKGEGNLSLIDISMYRKLLKPIPVY